MLNTSITTTESTASESQSQSLICIAEDYFYNLNPLTKRIGDDIKSTKEAYEEMWGSLSLKEKNQAIDETIIQPKVAFKYNSLSNVESSINDSSKCYPRLRIQTGLKYIIDETGQTLKWRDEHSGPFSFMTQSQMNLNLLGNSENLTAKLSENYDQISPHFSSPIKMEESSIESLMDDYSGSTQISNFYQSDSYSDHIFKDIDCSNRLNTINDGNIFTKLINKTSSLKISNSDDDLEILVSQKNSIDKNLQKNNVGNKNQMNINLSRNLITVDTNESTALLETPSSYSSFQSSKTNNDDIPIPKTGFEFLDNW